MFANPANVPDYARLIPVRHPRVKVFDDSFSLSCFASGFKGTNRSFYHLRPFLRSLTLIAISAANIPVFVNSALPPRRLYCVNAMCLTRVTINRLSSDKFRLLPSPKIIICFFGTGPFAFSHIKTWEYIHLSGSAILSFSYP